jgi:plastocyanin
MRIPANQKEGVLSHALGRLGRLRLALSAGLIASALVLALVYPGASVHPVSAAQSWNVQVSAEDASTQLMGQGFYPSPLTIHVGDTVSWNWASSVIHTVTFYGGEAPPTFLLPGPDPGSLQAGPAFFPAGPQEPGAEYDGVGLASSGAHFGPAEPDYRYSLTFTQPGVFEYVCTIHPGMHGFVTVVDANAELPENPEQAGARGAATQATVLAMIAADAARVQSAAVGPVHTALAGLGNGFGASALSFLPGDVQVKQGETVAWTIADPYEIHTVSFLSGQAPPLFEEVRPQPEGPPQIVFAADIVNPVGGNTYSGLGYVNSGVFGPGGSFALTILAPPGTYTYVCIIHPQMIGTITVVE